MLFLRYKYVWRDYVDFMYLQPIINKNDIWKELNNKNNNDKQ